jgi:hypothetical protein
MAFLEENIDICDTPINQIIKYVLSCSSFKGVDIDLMRLKIIRQKQLLKRLRAKNRGCLQKKQCYS